MSELALAGTVEVGGIEIIKVLEVVGEVNDFSRRFVHVEGVDTARARGDRGKRMSGKIGAEDVRFAFFAGREEGEAGRGPAQLVWDEVEIIDHKMRSGAAGRVS